MREKKMIKNVAAFLLTLAMVITCIPAMNVNADEENQIVLETLSGYEVQAEIGEDVELSVETTIYGNLDPDDITYTWYYYDENDEYKLLSTTTGNEGKTYTVKNFTKACDYHCDATAPGFESGYAFFHVYHENNFKIKNGEEESTWMSIYRQCDFGEDIELSVELVGDEIEDGVTYQWYNSNEDNPILGETGQTLKINSLKTPCLRIMEATDKFGNVVYAYFYINLNENISYRYPATVTTKSGNDVTLSVTPFIDGKDLNTTEFYYEWSIYNEEDDYYKYVGGSEGPFTFKNVTKDMKVMCAVSCGPENREFYMEIKVGDFPEPPSTEEPSNDTTEAKKDTTEVKKGTTPVVSNIKVSSIKIDGLSKKIAAGKKVRLQAIVAPQNATNKAVIWTSSNPKVATVDRTGLVKLSKKAAGKSVVITATTVDGGAKATYKIKAVKGIVKKVKVSGAKTVKAGKALKLKAKVLATKGANKKLVWTSSNENYAIVKNGKVKTLKAGKGKKIKITAMATDGSGKKATVKVKIK